MLSLPGDLVVSYAVVAVSAYRHFREGSRLSRGRHFPSGNSLDLGGKHALFGKRGESVASYSKIELNAARLPQERQRKPAPFQSWRRC
jgi:hypothetical protein